MSDVPSRDRIVGQPLVGIAHSPYSEPVFIVEGIGPASFRSHYLTLGNGTVVNLHGGGIATDIPPRDATPGETHGIEAVGLIGLRLTSVVRDDVETTLVLLEGGIFLKDDHDGFYGNLLLAGRLSEHYTDEELASFVDHWTGQPVSLAADA